jgi:hypothetical protein
MLQERDLVPRWMLRKICEHNGVRLPKRKLWEPPVVPHERVGPPTNLVRLRHDRTVHTPIERQAQVLADKQFDFENWEYRFYCVEVQDRAPCLATCRRCSSSFFARKARRAHIGENGCSKAVLRAYELLLRDKKCVICDTRTEHCEWGVPLCCTNKCKDAFMHEEIQSEALEAALLVVENQDLMNG